MTVIPVCPSTVCSVPLCWMKVIFAIPGLLLGYLRRASLRYRSRQHKEWAFRRSHA
jgi:hypothetical protein